MHKLFYLSFLRTLQRLATPQLNITEIDQLLINNKITNSGQDMLYRLPRQQLKHITNIPCPINSLQQNHANQIIRAAKTLRNHCKYDQKKICFRCPFVASCPSAKKPLQSYTYNNTLKDLLIYFYGLQNYMNPDAIYYRQWVSAYKIGDSVIAAIQDLSKDGTQIKEYERIRLAAIQQYKQKTATIQAAKVKSDISNQEKVVKLEQILNKQQKVQKSSPFSKEATKDKPISSDQTPKIKQALGSNLFDQQEQFEPVTKFTKESIQKKENSILNQSESSQSKQIRQQKKKAQRQQSVQQFDEQRQQKPKLRKIQIQNTINSDIKSSKRQKMSNYYGSQKDVEQRLNKSSSKDRYSDSRQYSQQKSYKPRSSQTRQGQYQKKDYDPRNKYSNFENSYNKTNTNYKNKYSDRSRGDNQDNKGYNSNSRNNNSRYNNDDRKYNNNQSNYNSNQRSGNYKNKYNNNSRYNDEQNNGKVKYNKYNNYNKNQEGGQDSYNPKIKSRGDFANNNSYVKNDRRNEEKSPFVMKWNDQKSDKFSKGSKNAYDDDFTGGNKKTNKSFSEQASFTKQQFKQTIKAAKGQPKMIEIEKINGQVQTPKAGRKVTRRRSSSSNDQL